MSNPMRFLITFLCLVVYIHAKSWNKHNAPSTFLFHHEPDRFEYKLSALPSHASLPEEPFSGYFIQDSKGGIAERMVANYRTKKESCSQSDVVMKVGDHFSKEDLEILSDTDIINIVCPAKRFFYPLYTKEDLMHSIDISRLFDISAAEKYDILQARYDYPTVHSEWNRTHPGSHYWTGLTQGSAASASCFPRDQSAVTMIKNKDGVIVPLLARDIESLLSYYVGVYEWRKLDYIQTGEQCFEDIIQHPKLANNSECEDINPGAFHVILTNLIGIQKRGFVADVARSAPVWNKPVFKYTMNIGKHPEKLPGRVKVQTKVYMSTEVWEPFVSTNIMERIYEYYLELNHHGEITGGEYTTYPRFDYVWAIDCKQITPFKGYFSHLEWLIQMEGVKEKNVQLPRPDISNHMQTSELEPYEKNSLLHTSNGFFSLHAGDKDHCTCSGSVDCSCMYQSNEMKGSVFSWTIPHACEEDGSCQVELIFSNMHLVSHKHLSKDHASQPKIRIYEGSNGQGPLLAVIHESYDKKHIIHLKLGSTDGIKILVSGGMNERQLSFDGTYHIVKNKHNRKSMMTMSNNFILTSKWLYAIPVFLLGMFMVSHVACLRAMGEDQRRVTFGSPESEIIPLLGDKKE